MLLERTRSAWSNFIRLYVIAVGLNVPVPVFEFLSNSSFQSHIFVGTSSVMLLCCLFLFALMRMLVNSQPLSQAGLIQQLPKDGEFYTTTNSRSFIATFLLAMILVPLYLLTVVYHFTFSYYDTTINGFGYAILAIGVTMTLPFVTGLTFIALGERFWAYTQAVHRWHSAVHN